MDGPQENSRNQGSELSTSTMVLRSTAVVDMTREDEANLRPGNVGGTAGPIYVKQTRHTKGRVSLLFVLLRLKCAS